MLGNGAGEEENKGRKQGRGEEEQFHFFRSLNSV